MELGVISVWLNDLCSLLLKGDVVLLYSVLPTEQGQFNIIKIDISNYVL